MRLASAAGALIVPLLMLAPTSAIAEGKDVVHETSPGEFKGRIVTAPDRALGKRHKPSGDTSRPRHKRTLTKIVLKKTDRQLRKWLFTIQGVVGV